MTEIKLIERILEKQILILDGPMGTMIQEKKLDENDFRGKKFLNSKKNLKGNNDLLSLTCPDLIYEIHQKYLEAGADILETNTFNSTKISQKDYDCDEFSFDLNYQGGLIARKAVDDFLNKNPGQNRFVAGVLGPTNRTCSMSPDVNDPGFRNVNFDVLKDDYKVYWKNNPIAKIKKGINYLSPEIEVIADEALDINFRKNLVFELNSWIKNLISVELKDLIGLIKFIGRYTVEEDIKKERFIIKDLLELEEILKKIYG